MRAAPAPAAADAGAPVAASLWRRSAAALTPLLRKQWPDPMCRNQQEGFAAAHGVLRAR